MPPITKFWLSTLKDEESVNTPAFRQFLSELLEFCSSYTNPEPNTVPMHAFYQDTKNPSRLFMISGYQSQELNTEADNVYAKKYLPGMFEYVQHKVLRQLDIDVTALPLDQNIVVSYGKRPSEWKSERDLGGWDVWPETRQAQKNENNAVGERDLANEDEKVWVQASRWEDGRVDGAQIPDGERLYLRKILSR